MLSDSDAERELSETHPRISWHHDSLLAQMMTGCDRGSERMLSAGHESALLRATGEGSRACQGCQVSTLENEASGRGGIAVCPKVCVPREEGNLIGM